MRGRREGLVNQDAKQHRTKVVENLVFVPYTRTLQTLDDTLGECMGSLAVGFVDRCGRQ